MDEISVETYQKIVENIADGLRVLDARARIIYANQALCRMLGYSREELLGRPVFMLYPPAEHPEVENRLAELRQGRTLRYQSRYQAKDGRFLYISVSSVPIFDSKDRYNGCYTVIQDITEQKELQNQVIAEKDFLNDLVELCPDGIVGVDRKGTIIIFNEAVERLTHYKSQEVIGQMHITELYTPSELARFIKKKLYGPEYGGRGRIEGMEVEVQDRYLRKIPIRLSATLIWKDGQEIGSVGYFHDMTQQKQIQAKLRQLSVTDSLSGVFNQRHFYSVLEKEVKRAERYERPLSLICFDIDHFKQFNDSLGHLEGDNIIRLVGQILREQTRQSDQSFRYGGDEFMVILPETELVEAYVCAEKIREQFNANWPLGDACEKVGLTRATLSLGVAAYNPGEISEVFIKRTDLAMYEAKRAGGDHTVEAVARIGRFQG